MAAEKYLQDYYDQLPSETADFPDPGRSSVELSDPTQFQSDDLTAALQPEVVASQNDEAASFNEHEADKPYEIGANLSGGHSHLMFEPTPASNFDPDPLDSTPPADIPEAYAFEHENLVSEDDSFRKEAAESPSQDKTEQSVVAEVSHMASEHQEADALKSADDNDFEPEDDAIMLVKDEPEEEEQDLDLPAVPSAPEPEIVDAAEVPPVVEDIETKPKPKTSDESLVPASGEQCLNEKEQAKDPVIDLIYWRDIKKSAFVFSFLMLMLCSLTVFSVIAVISYAGLALLTVTVAFRLYKLVLQTLNGTQQPHPFQELLDMDVTLSPEQVHKYTDATLSHVNCFLTCARSLLLVQNTVSSIKLGVFLWLMTYIGCCFNGLTLLIVDVVLAFTLPPLYEKYQTQIDAYCKLAREKITVALAAAKAKMPGAKQKTQ